MKKGNARTITAAALSCLLLLSGAVGLALLLTRGEEEPVPEVAVANTEALVQRAGVSFAVTDGETGQPLSGVYVVVPEGDYRGKTDESGASEVINVPCIRDVRFDSMVERDWGDITALFYKEGYATYALFYLQVRPGEIRQSVAITLYPESSLSTSLPFSIIEGPDRAWVEEVIEKYAK